MSGWSAPRTRSRASATRRYTVSASAQRPQPAEADGDLAAADQGVRVVGAEDPLADRAHVAGLGEGLLPAAEPAEVDAEAVAGAQGLGVGGALDPGAVVDQVAVELERPPRCGRGGRG